MPFTPPRDFSRSHTGTLRNAARRCWRAAPLLAVLALPAAAAPRPSSPSAPSATFDYFEYRGDDQLPVPGAGQYRNPILSGFYPDPSITRVGDEYYMVTSTFAWFPGIPVFHSKNLVDWQQIGNAIDRPGQLDFAALGLSRAVFAPDISYHDGLFYILNTCVDCGGNFVITARNPAGPWSDPVWLPEITGGIDPSMFFDADGTAWIVNNGPPVGAPRYEGHRALWLQRFDPAARKMVGKRTMLVDGGADPSTRPIWIEGPRIIQRGTTYYLIAAEGGTAEAHSQVVFRSDRVTGPYTPFKDNPILTQRDLSRDRPRPITSAGHADFVETAMGEWWATFLAVRPYQGDSYNTGRETFLLPVTWQDGWPRITKPGQTIPWTAARPALPAATRRLDPTSGPMRKRDEFSASRLGLEWMMMRQPRSTWWTLGNGHLGLVPRPVALGDNANPSFLARRQQHMNASATTRVRLTGGAGDEAGLVALQNDDYWYFIAAGRRGKQRTVKLRMRSGPGDPRDGRIVAENVVPVGLAAPVHLRIAARASAYDFSWSADGRRWTSLRTGADGTILSTARAGGFVGAVFGLHAYQSKGARTRQ